MLQGAWRGAGYSLSYMPRERHFFAPNEDEDRDWWDSLCGKHSLRKVDISLGSTEEFKAHEGLRDCPECLAVCQAVRVLVFSAENRTKPDHITELPFLTREAVDKFYQWSAAAVTVKGG